MTQQLKLYALVASPRALLIYALVQVNPAAAHALAGDREVDARQDRLFAAASPALHCAGHTSPVLHGVGFYANQVPQSMRRPASPATIPTPTQICCCGSKAAYGPTSPCRCDGLNRASAPTRTPSLCCAAWPCTTPTRKSPGSSTGKAAAPPGDCHTPPVGSSHCDTTGEQAVAARTPIPDDELLAAELARLDRRLHAIDAERRRLVDLPDRASRPTRTATPCRRYRRPPPKPPTTPRRTHHPTPGTGPRQPDPQPRRRIRPPRTGHRRPAHLRPASTATTPGRRRGPRHRLERDHPAPHPLDQPPTHPAPALTSPPQPQRQPKTVCVPLVPNGCAKYLGGPVEGSPGSNLASGASVVVEGRPSRPSTRWETNAIQKRAGRTGGPGHGSRADRRLRWWWWWW